MNDPCSAETKRKETPGTHPVCIHAIASNMGRLTVGPSFTMPCAHRTTCSVAALWRCRRRGWTGGRDCFMGGGGVGGYNMKSCLRRKCSPFDDDSLVEVCLSFMNTYYD